MWIGTAAGLNRFDGNRVKLYTHIPGDSTSLADLFVVGPMFEDAAGNLWFATSGAVHCYLRQADHFWRLPCPGVPEPIHLDEHGIFWFYCKGSLYRLDTKSALTAGFDPSLQKMSAGPLAGGRFSYVATPDTTFILAYHGDTGGVDVYRWHNGQLVRTRQLLKDFEIQHIYPASLDQYWLATSKGLVYWSATDAKSPTLYNTFDGVSIGRVQHVQPISPGELAVSTNTGLYFFNTDTRCFNKWFHHNPEDPGSLAADKLHTLFLDGERNLWISVWTKSIDYVNLDKPKFDFFRYKSRKSGSDFVVPGPLLESSDGTIWCGSQMYGLLALDAAGRLKADYSTEVPTPERLFDLGQGVLLVQLFDGSLIRFSPKTRLVEHLNLESVGAIVKIGKNRFYVAPQGQPGLFCLQISASGSPVKEPIPGLESIDRIFYWGCAGRHAGESFWADERNNICQLQTSSGAVLNQITTVSSLPHAGLASGQDCWIGGAFGLLHLNGQSPNSRLLGSSEGLPDNTVYGILLDPAQNLWLSTNKGLVRCRKDLKDFHLYTLIDGLQDPEFNRNSALITRDNHFWLGGINGVNRFDPLSVRHSQLSPQVQLTGLSVLDIPWVSPHNLSEQSEFTFPWSQRTLSFSFAGLDFSDPANVRLKYRLEYQNGSAYDKDWVLCPDAKGFARYANLPAGKFRLNLMAANSDGDWEKAGVRQIHFSIAPPFWQTVWFWILMGMLCVGILWYWYNRRVKKLKAENLRKLEMAEAEMKALRAQLSPHFINNSLNSLRAFILRNDLAGADEYLSGFARLTRAILESSIHHTVELEAELDLLRAYVKIETKHLPYPIEYREELSDDLDPFEIQVPGMLLQPFVENALVHGLKPLGRAGRLLLRIEQKMSYLLFTVEDNGVGRPDKPSTEGGKPPSRALQITTDRLKYYDQRHGTNSVWRLTDLKDAAGNPAGTSVEIRLGLPKNLS